MFRAGGKVEKRGSKMNSYQILGWIIIGVCTFGAAVIGPLTIHHGNKKAESTRPPDLYFRELTSYYIPKQKDIYTVGVVVEIVNKEPKAYIVNGIQYKGMVEIDVSSASITLFSLSNFDFEGEVTGKYYLKAGDRTFVKMEIPHETKMHILGGTPKLKFEGQWTIFIENIEINVTPKKIVNRSVISEEEWQKLYK